MRDADVSGNIMTFTDPKNVAAPRRLPAGHGAGSQTAASTPGPSCSGTAIAATAADQPGLPPAVAEAHRQIARAAGRATTSACWRSPLPGAPASDGRSAGARRMRRAGPGGRRRRPATGSWPPHPAARGAVRGDRHDLRLAVGGEAGPDRPGLGGGRAPPRSGGDRGHAPGRRLRGLPRRDLEHRALAVLCGRRLTDPMASPRNTTCTTPSATRTSTWRPMWRVGAE